MRRLPAEINSDAGMAAVCALLRSCVIAEMGCQFSNCQALLELPSTATANAPRGRPPVVARLSNRSTTYPAVTARTWSSSLKVRDQALA